MESEFITFCINNGFAVAVSVFVLVRLETTLKKNTDAIISLKEEMLLQRQERK